MTQNSTTMFSVALDRALDTLAIGRLVTLSQEGSILRPELYDSI